MAFHDVYGGGGGGHHRGHHHPPRGHPPQPPPRHPIRDSWVHDEPQQPPPLVPQKSWTPVRNHEPDPELYESIYDSRWRLLNQEAARLQREQTWTPATLSPAPGSSSSRESSLDPSNHVVHAVSSSVLSTRSPRQIVIQRSEDGFGFTLRHFIVYPPEEPSLDGNGVDIKEPLDTIFVKSVRETGPAHLAGLQCGDRIISVNGETVTGKSYAEVVGLIQRLRDNLSLIVVPKQDDILQMYFSDIAQNPETNQRPTRESFIHASGFLPTSPASMAYPQRESSPYTDFVNNGPTRIAMHTPQRAYRAPPDPVLPPWVSPTSVASTASTSTEHVYAMPARVIRTSEERLEHDPRSVGSLVSLDSSWRPSSSMTSPNQPPPPRTLCDSKESVPNDSDPVISRIKRDFERKQEFLRTTNLPNYLGSPTPSSVASPSEAAAAGAVAAAAAAEYYKQQLLPQQQAPIVQVEERRPPVYFGDRFPVQHHSHHHRVDEDDGQRGDRGSGGQFHLYGLQLGYRRSGRQFDEDEAYVQQQQQQQAEANNGGVGAQQQQALSHHHLLSHQHSHQVHHHLFHQHRNNSGSSNTYQSPRQVYLNAHHDGSGSTNIIPSNANAPTTSSSSRSSNGPVVLRRKKKQQQHHHQNLDDEEERNLRRVSYLRATKEDRMQLDSDLEQEIIAANQEHVSAANTPKQSTSEGGDITPRHAPSIQRIRALFGEKGEESCSGGASVAQCHPESLREGWLHCKVTSIEGKKSVDRSWRNVYAVLTGDSLTAYKDKKIFAASSEQNNQLSFEEVPQIILSESGVEIADDYTKRKHVFRLRSEAGSEVLYQAENEATFQAWLASLENIYGPGFVRSRKLTSASVINAGAPTTAAAAAAAAARSRSPTGHSPATKSRKPSADQGPMTKESSNKKTWKGKVAKQWKRMHGTGSSPAQNTSYPEGGSIGVPLEDCPMCPDLESVPMLVRTCCRMVEEKGLDIVGIYRVPGNSAAVNALTEQVNTRGEECFVKMDDPKWNDVNVVTSLLKSFFRKLPDPIFTTEMYNVFIEASKIEESNRRLNALRKLMRELPEVNFDTLHHLCSHLVKVVSHCETNKMEIRNLAIVFGPTLVRPADDNMLSMVTDMSQQCRIIESILTNFEWFFNNNEDDDFDEDEVEADKIEDSATSGLQNSSSGNKSMDLIKLMETSGSEAANHSVLLSNLQKLEDAGKMIGLSGSSSSGNKDVSAKDIVSGIISAANRKMLRAATGSQSKSGNKKDSVGNETSKSNQKLDAIDSSGKHQAASRRNSESVFHGAVTIAAAVPQLMINAGNSMSTSNLPAASTSEVMTSAASHENLVNVESTMMSSSTSRIVSTASFYDETGYKEDSTGKKIKFPIETYQGLEKATAERVRRFVDETKANLLRGRLESSPNLNSNRTTSDAHVETWTDDLAGGILFQDDPYPVSPYNERVQAQDRFLNLTYRSPSVIRTPERLLRGMTSSSGSPAVLTRGGLTRGLSLGELNPHREMLSPLEFDTKKVATHGTLKRLKLVKSPTDTQLFVPNQVPPHLLDPANESMLTSLTADFDEKMKLLLDPNYSGGSQSDTSSVQSTPSKYAKLRRVSEQPRKHHPAQQTDKNAKTNRSISLGEDSQNVCSEKQLSILNEQQRNNKKSELKRGRLVDKHHPPKRSDGLDGLEGKENKNKTSPSEVVTNRVKLRNRRLRRRHTVGGTKDFADIDIEADNTDEDAPGTNVVTAEAFLSDLSHPTLSQYHHSVMQNVDRSLGQWIRRQQKMGKSSPDLSLIGRRLSLPDSVLAASAAGNFYPFTSLLESQV